MKSFRWGPGVRTGAIDVIAVVPCGTVVYLCGKIAARVTGVAIYPSGVKYRVAWFAGGTRHEEWVSEVEFESSAAQQKVVGFAACG